MSYRVLIADDEKPIRQWMARCLLESGRDVHIVGEAENGEEALRLYREHQPDIVFTDIIMPLLDGLDFISAARELGGHCCFVVLTCHEDFGFAHRAIHNQVFRYVVKYRTGEEELLEILDHAIEQRKQGTETWEIRWADAAREQVLHRLLHAQEGGEAGTLWEGSVVALACTPNRAEIGDWVRTRCSALLNGTASCYEGDTLMVAGALRQSSTLLALTQLSEMVSELCRERCLDFGVSDIVHGKTGVSHALWQACDSLAGCFFSDRPTVIFYRDLQQDRVWESELHQLATSAAESLRMGELERFSLSLDTMLALGQQAVRRDPTIYRTTVLDLLLQLYNGATARGMQPEYTPQELRRFIMRQKKRRDFEEVIQQTVQHLIVPLKEKDSSSGNVIHRVKQYIRVHYREPVSLEAIAAHVHLNPSYLSSLFRDKTGETITAFLTGIRLEEADRLIDGNNLPLSEIAARVGYPNPSYFSQIYKKHRGCPPNERREQSG